jgi:hypothetical protein
MTWAAVWASRSIPNTVTIAEGSWQQISVAAILKAPRFSYSHQPHDGFEMIRTDVVVGIVGVRSLGTQL